MNNDPIAETLNIAPVVPEQEVQLPAVITSEPIVASNNDLQLASQNLRSLATKGETALDEIMEVAKLSQHPRAYEVIAAMIGQLAQVNRQIVDTTKVKKELESIANTNSGNVTNQNLFIGSTAELAKFLELQRGRKG